MPTLSPASADALNAAEERKRPTGSFYAVENQVYRQQGESHDPVCSATSADLAVRIAEALNAAVVASHAALQSFGREEPKA